MTSIRNLLFPPPATLTEANLPSQDSKVFIVTGSSGGLGKALANILYEANAKVYIAARSASKAAAAISEISALHPASTGELHYLHLDLSDLSTIRASAEEFLSKEKRLDVLWNNAGVMVPPEGSKSAQGYELQIGTNNLGPFLFLHFLTPLLVATAKRSDVQKNSVRVVWVSSSAAVLGPKPAIDFENMDYKKKEGIWDKYSRSKAGNVIHSVELARRIGGEGVISLSLNPGNFVTDLQRSMPRWQYYLLKLVAYPPINGAYTQLFAGLHPDITEENNGGWVAPFGRLVPGREDLYDEALGKKYWEWSEEQVKPFY